MAGPRMGGPKDAPGIRNASNRPLSSSPSRTAGDSHYQHRGAGYQQQHAGSEQSHGQHPSGTSTMGNTAVAEGVYSNKRFMHACTCLIGTTVQVSYQMHKKSQNWQTPQAYVNLAYSIDTRYMDIHNLDLT